MVIIIKITDYDPDSSLCLGTTTHSCSEAGGGAFSWRSCNCVFKLSYNFINDSFSLSNSCNDCLSCSCSSVSSSKSFLRSSYSSAISLCTYNTTINCYSETVRLFTLNINSYLEIFLRKLFMFFKDLSRLRIVKIWSKRS